MSLYNLPPELISNIVSFLDLHKIRLGPYAALSKTWQRVVEASTFARFKLTSNDIDDFTSFVVDSHLHRKAAIRTIDFTAVLPAYGDAACARFETDQDRELNNEDFSGAVSHLFGALSTCENVEKARPITLRFQSPYSPVDLSHRGAEKYAEDKAAFDTGRRNDLWEHRYEHSYLRLLSAETLPTLHRVISFSVFAAVPRFVEPASVATICTKLPMLENADMQLNDGERKHPLLRAQLRHGLAQQLRAVNLPCMKNLHLSLQHEAPFNEGFMNADVREEGQDIFSAALRKFLQAQTASKIKLDGPICTDSELFWPSDAGGQQQSWPHVQDFSMSFSAVRPDGGWYFDRDPNVPSASELDPREDTNATEDSDEDSGSEYDTGDSFFEKHDGEEAPDEYDDEKERRALGISPTRSFRTSPTPSLERLLEASARAAAHMPQLHTMAVGADIQPSDRTSFNPQSFEFEYTAKGFANWKDQGTEDVEHPRLYWTVPRGWVMSKGLEALWMTVLGQGGVVSYEEW